jgi:hypothetical protein
MNDISGAELAGPGVFGPPRDHAGKSPYLVAANMMALFEAARVGGGMVVWATWRR